MRPAASIALAVALLASLVPCPARAAEREGPPGLATIDAGTCRFLLPPQNEGVARKLGPVCSRASGKIFEQLGVEAGGAPMVEVRIAGTPAGIKDLAVPHAAPPEWSGAVAYPDHGIIVLSLTHGDGRPVEDLEVMLEHELSHLAMRRALGGARVPRWFSEGVAIQQSEGSSLGRSAVLRLAAAGDRLLPLESIENYPTDRADVALAYAQAADFTGHLLGDLGWHGVRVVLNRLRAGDDFEEAFQAAYGGSVARMEREWRRGLREEWNWLALITGSGALWGVIVVLFVAAYVVVLRRQRRRLAQMEAEEAPLERLLSVIHDLEAKAAGSHVGGGADTAAAAPDNTRTKIEVDGELHTLH
jgi:hypothetical protein